MTTATNTTLNRSRDPGTSAANGIVASTIGTAPRNPAHPTNSCSRTPRLNHTAHATTDSGRATNVRIAPAASPCHTCHQCSSSGLASRPSMTNNPIWASQPMPSTNDRVATRCGSSVLPSTSAATYTAANPLAWTYAAEPYASTANANTTRG